MFCFIALDNKCLYCWSAYSIIYMLCLIMWVRPCSLCFFPFLYCWMFSVVSMVLLFIYYLLSFLSFFFVGESSRVGRLWLDPCWCNGWSFCSKHHHWTSCGWCFTASDRSSFGCSSGTFHLHNTCMSCSKLISCTFLTLD